MTYPEMLHTAAEIIGGAVIVTTAVAFVFGGWLFLYSAFRALVRTVRQADQQRREEEQEAERYELWRRSEDEFLKGGKDA